MAALIHRDPSQRMTCEKVLQRVRAIRDEGLQQDKPPDDDDSLHALVPASPSPTRSQPFFSPPPIKAELIEAGHRLPIGPPRQPGLTTAARTRLVSGAFALAKAFTMISLCGASSPLTSTALWLVVGSVVVDFAVADGTVSLALMALHITLLFLGVGWIGRAGLCFARVDE